MSETELHDRLKEDWGYDLPIRVSGEGAGSRDNPIVIFRSENISILETAYLTIHGLQRGLSVSLKENARGDNLVGVLWRSLEGGLQYDPETELYVFRCEKNVLTDDQIETITSRFYFKIDDGKITAQNSGLPEGIGVSALKVTFPYEIGYLKLDTAGSVDYAAEHNRPDLGLSIAYNALGIKATVYVYPFGSRSSLHTEFERGAKEVEAMNSDMIAWPDREFPDGIHRYWRFGEQGNEVTMLGLTTARGNFVKLRMTWRRDQLIDKAAKEFADVITSLSRLN